MTLKQTTSIGVLKHGKVYRSTNQLQMWRGTSLSGGLMFIWKGENPMCETCSHMLKQAMNGKLCCNCRESEYYDTTVAADHVCDKYIAVKDNHCAMLRFDGKCRGLTVTKCNGCKFFKTKAQLAAERKQSQERLQKLPREKQLKIMEAYGLTSF